MKSFRLDRQSVADFTQSSPLIVACIGMSVWLGYQGWFDPVWRVLLVVFAGFYFGYVLRESLTQSLKERYPKARRIGLLAIGLVVATIGVVTRMAFPATQGGLLDSVWLSISFIFILTFIIVNRRDPDVVR